MHANMAWLAATHRRLQKQSTLAVETEDWYGATIKRLETSTINLGVTSMMGRSAGVIGILVAALALLTACHNDKQPSNTTGGPAASAADPDPHWVIQQSPRAKVALVYVHGVTGDMVGTWTASNGKTFFDLVNENPATKGKADAFVFGFPSFLLTAGSFDIREAANRLHLQLKTQGVLDYPAVVFVAHSMGGLVVMKELLTNRDVLAKVPVVVFYATPMEGSLIAEVGKEFSPNSALAQMTPADGNALLQSLSDDWQSITGPRPHVRCAYEKTPVGPAMIVPWTSATRFCEGAPPPIEASHITIVKPDRPGADAILVLVSALNDYVLGKSLEAKLETPDFTQEGDAAVFVLHDALGKQTARLVNSGGSPLTFTLAEISDPTKLFLWPDDTPEDIKPHDKVALGIALSRSATANEYRFTIRTPLADKKVIVRVPDLAVLEAQRAAVANQVATDIQATLNDPQQRQRLLAAPQDASSEAIVQIAHAAVSKQASALPDQARWVTHRGSALGDELADVGCASPAKRRSRRAVNGSESSRAAAGRHRRRAVGRSRNLQVDPHVGRKPGDPLGLEGRAAAGRARQRRGRDDAGEPDEEHRHSQRLWVQSGRRPAAGDRQYHGGPDGLHTSREDSSVAVAVLANAEGETERGDGRSATGPHGTRPPESDRGGGSDGRRRAVASV